MDVNSNVNGLHSEPGFHHEARCPTWSERPRSTGSPPETAGLWPDNAPEAMLSLVTNTAVRSGLKPSVAKDQRASDFPYVIPA
jgi:hypothetical protein